MAAALDVARLKPARGMAIEGAAGLAVLDFSAPADFVLPHQAGAAIAADARLDEPADLAARLGMPAATPDDALVLASLRSWGPEGLARVLGDFAFASWDSTAGVLTCGRDIFGIRPFVYAWRPRSLFAFASFSSALHGCGIVAKELDEMAVARGLIRAAQADETLLAGIARLPPAHILQVSRDGLTCRRFFQFDRAAVGSRNCSPGQAAAGLRQAIEQAIASRLPKDGAVASHLSGGLDSSAVTVLGARILRAKGRKLHAFTVLDRQHNDISLEDESDLVRAVTDQEPDLDWSEVRPPSPAAALNDPFEADRVVRSSPDRPHRVIAASARARNISLILSGWGGDEAASYGGSAVLWELFRRGQWFRLAREIKALERERTWPRWRTIRHNLILPLLPRLLRQVARGLRGCQPFPDQLQSMLSKSVRSKIAQWPGRSEAPVLSRWDWITSPRLTEGAENMAYIAALHGVAVAFPLLDKRVVEYALSLPTDLLLRDGVGRRVFRDAMQGVLPDSVRLNQRKLVSVPSRAIDFADCKDDLLAKLDRLAENDAVRRVIDVDHLREEIARIPAAAFFRQQLLENRPSAEIARMNAVLLALFTAEYVAQNAQR